MNKKILVLISVLIVVYLGFFVWADLYKCQDLRVGLRAQEPYESNEDYQQWIEDQKMTFPEWCRFSIFKLIRDSQ